MYAGEFPVNHTTVPILFTTHASDGSPVAPLSAFEAADVKLFKNGSDVERTSQAGWTMTSPFNSHTGLHRLLIDTSDNTDAGFYAAGSTYTAVLVPDETVDGLAVIKVIGQFKIVLATPVVDVTQWNGTAVATPTVAGVPEVDLTHWLGTAAATPTVAGVPEVDLTHVAGSTTSVSVLATNVAAILVDTGTTLQGEIDDLETDINTLISRLTAARALLLDNLGNLTDPVATADALATVSAAVDAIKTKSDQLVFTNPNKVDAAILDAGDLDQAVADLVWTSPTRELTSGTNIVLDKGTGLTGLNDISAADVWTAGTRTLTSFGTLIADLWTYPTRTLTSLGTLADDVWASASRTLTSFGTLPSDIWAVSTRTLTSFGTLVTDIWAAGTRTLTSFGTLAADVWAVGTRSLTTFGTLAADVWAVVLENSKTALQFMRLIYATTVNKSVDTETGTIRYRDDADTKDRVVWETDADNNRTTSTKDAT